MKKAILAILACLYLVVTSGMQLQFHYCMGHLQRTSLAVLPDAKCGSCGMEKDKSGCCHTEKQWVKIQDNHQPSVAATALPTPLEVALLPVIHYFSDDYLPIISSSPAANHSPPLFFLSGRLHVLYSVFRI